MEKLQAGLIFKPGSRLVRWQYLTGGLKNTLIITFICDLCSACALGLLIAFVRATHDKLEKNDTF